MSVCLFLCVCVCMCVCEKGRGKRVLFLSPILPPSSISLPFMKVFPAEQSQRVCVDQRTALYKSYLLLSLLFWHKPFTSQNKAAWLWVGIPG